MFIDFVLLGKRRVPFSSRRLLFLSLIIRWRRFSFSRHLVFDTGRRGADNRFMSYPSPHAPPCLLDSRLALPSHLIGHRLACRLPVLRHGWAGREAGSVGALCLLGFCPAVFADVDKPVYSAFSAASPRSVCLSARLRGNGVLISSCGMCCDVLLAHRTVSSFASFIIPSVGSVSLVSRPVSRHDGRGDGRLRLAIVLRFDFLLPASFPLCLLASERFSPSI